MSIAEILFVVAFFATCTLIVWKVTRFEYVIDGENLRMRWWFLGLVPIGWKLDISSITHVQKIRFGFSHLFVGPPTFGKPAREMVLIVRKKGFLKRIMISPSDIDGTIKALTEKMRQIEQSADLEAGG